MGFFDVVMDDIRYLTAQKIQEILTYCEVSELQDETVRQHITGIANFVHDSRLKAGLNGLPEYFKHKSISVLHEPVVDLRGSPRIRATKRKKEPLNYRGLDVSPRKKRLIAGKLEIKDKVSKNSGADATADDHSYATARETDNCDLCTTPATSSMEAHQRGSDVSSTAHEHAGQLEQTNSLVPPVGEAKTSPEQADVHMILPSDNHATTSPPMPDMVGSAGLMKEVLLECVTLNYAMGKYAQDDPDRINRNVIATADIETIRNNAYRIADLGYQKALYSVTKEKSVLAGRDIQTRYLETVYWEIIKKGEELLDPGSLPSQKGRRDEFTMAEKVAVRRFMLDAGYGISDSSQQRYRRLWKRLHDMRHAGVDKILFYRTRKLDDFLVDFPRDAKYGLIDLMLSWEQKYNPEIAMLEDRVWRASQGDDSGRAWLNTPGIAGRLEIPDPTQWNCARNQWFSQLEETEFRASSRSLKASEQELGGLLETSMCSRNKSVFISLRLEADGQPSVVPIIDIAAGEFLGIFAGHLRYSGQFDTIHGIRGPRENLWVDYSRVTGVLNQMRVSPPNGDANVCLVWELFEVIGESVPQWRVSVRALRSIKAFDEVFRAAGDEVQFYMHQEGARAKTGFLK